MKPQSKLLKHLIVVVFAAILILLIPLIAMQISSEIKWSPLDFVAAGILLMITGFAFVLVTFNASNKIYRIAVGMALGTALFMVWSNLAVGLIGSEDNPINALYLGVLIVGIIGAIISKLRPVGMFKALLATALAQGLITFIALFAGFGNTFREFFEIINVNGFFIVLWLASAWMFRSSARKQEAILK